MEIDKFLRGSSEVGDFLDEFGDDDLVLAWEPADTVVDDDEETTAVDQEEDTTVNERTQVQDGQ